MVPVGRDVAVPQHLGCGVTLPQSGYALCEGGFLLFGAVVYSGAVGGDATNIGDVYGHGVVAFHPVGHFLFVEQGVQLTVGCHEVVIAGVPPAPCLEAVRYLFGCAMLGVAVQCTKM